MKPPDDSVRLRHMLDAAEKATLLTQSLSRKDLDVDETLVLALTRLVEIIGEAANGISQTLRDAHREIPWKQMVGARHHLIHGYFDVDLDILWQIAKSDLPKLIDNLKALIEKH